jgi:serine/threonine-protein kinase HipA
MSELIVILDGEPVATLTQEGGRTRLVYEDGWLAGEAPYPLSLSMPLTLQSHPPGRVDPFLWGLLPDNEHVIQRWARKFGVSAGNGFALIGHVGEDCAGAAQFVRPERLDALADGRDEGIEWLTEDEVAARMRALRDDAAAGRTSRDRGQFSLAGAQPKTAFYRDGDRWGVPTGRIPTTHILKPTTAKFDGHSENEHLCMATASSLGLLTAESEVSRFGDVSVIVVKRFDRQALDGEMVRIHQEDTCQALSVHPSRKYQNDGGPGAREIAALLRTNVYQPPDAGADVGDVAENDVWRFVDALLFNWLIGGTDAHAKNYSLLIGSGGLVRMAPLYDLASIFAYPDLDRGRAKLAMKVADKYRLEDIRLRHWEKFASELQLEPDAVIERARWLADALPDGMAETADQMRGEGIDHPVLDEILAGVRSQTAKVTGA